MATPLGMADNEVGERFNNADIDLDCNADTGGDHGAAPQAEMASHADDTETDDGDDSNNVVMDTGH